ncbi:CatB-related O-acetyltransferase [Pontibacter burrus]|uniref:CatB-related O-acetyltransferase n=1 Tax=Pontibacter burrus TaxID=2704466 RepID=A0A6B3LRM1_9BACT|nr:CatB-related O-acetyltransferase [Pontibacter burrus]NEM96144.1 CatB-related O-acetyltransferase [Pontibacter burrus]
MNGPDPNATYPLPHHHKLVFLKSIIQNPNIIVGDYTYYDDLEDPHNFEKNVLYHFDFIGDKLIIGKFCSIASGVKFIMNGGNHETKPISSFPFEIFGNGWERIADKVAYPFKGDTVVENDVWIGTEAVIMPGVRVGNGAVIASKSVVAKDVPDYAIVAGNPAVVVKMRFTEEQIQQLLTIAWWNWSGEKISRNLHLIHSTDIDALAVCQ